MIFLKKGGADAVKFQTYKAELITGKFARVIGIQKKKKQKASFNYLKSMTCLKKNIIKNYLTTVKKSKYSLYPHLLIPKQLTCLIN